MLAAAWACLFGHLKISPWWRTCRILAHNDALFDSLPHLYLSLPHLYLSLLFLVWGNRPPTYHFQDVVLSNGFLRLLRGHNLLPPLWGTHKSSGAQRRIPTSLFIVDNKLQGSATICFSEYAFPPRAITVPPHPGAVAVRPTHFLKNQWMLVLIKGVDTTRGPLWPIETGAIIENLFGLWCYDLWFLAGAPVSLNWKQNYWKIVGWRHCRVKVRRCELQKEHGEIVK